MALSTRLFGAKFLTAVDDHTVAFDAFDAVPGAVAYVPIPVLHMAMDNEDKKGEKDGTQGDVPTTHHDRRCKATQVSSPSIYLQLSPNDTLDVLVRRVSTRSAPLGPDSAGAEQLQQSPTESDTWQAISGPFQVRIRETVWNTLIPFGIAAELYVIRTSVTGCSSATSRARRRTTGFERVGFGGPAVTFPGVVANWASRCWNFKFIPGGVDSVQELGWEWHFSRR